MQVLKFLDARTSDNILYSIGTFRGTTKFNTTKSVVDYRQIVSYSRLGVANQNRVFMYSGSAKNKIICKVKSTGVTVCVNN